MAVTTSSGCAPDVDPAPVLDVTPDEDTGAVTLEVAQHPNLARVGGAVTLRGPGINPLLLMHRSEGRFSVMDATCTHMGCPLGYDGRDVVCPCHAARFDSATGEATLRPARTALQVVGAEKVTYLSGVLTIQVADARLPAIVDGTLALGLDAYPQLSLPGGGVAGTPRGRQTPIYVSRRGDGSVVAVNALCTHAGFKVSRNGDHLACSGHGATFDLDGRMRLGPWIGPNERGATDDLQQLVVSATPELVTILVPEE
ncbi:Rieske 2Fe-2S domain-containing protein [Myxococcus sp. K15C18031901]|uniref:Rieske 2Fe-2S domain-containing protein n=1 Tax=Myxococcus dinghuensis TaxID=2906761 RepID=UPI0020A7DF9D|nr:Rieske 2Fe-2S domain-containing protein [Myxococcus dinghuensis]MCP3097899.1 Rieske 2Fe-2S domain-containing protein [Myxococcus dinghuensis]